MLEYIFRSTPSGNPFPDNWSDMPKKKNNPKLVTGEVKWTLTDRGKAGRCHHLVDIDGKRVRGTAGIKLDGYCTIVYNPANETIRFVERLIMDIDEVPRGAKLVLEHVGDPVARWGFLPADLGGNPPEGTVVIIGSSELVTANA